MKKQDTENAEMEQGMMLGRELFASMKGRPANAQMFAAMEMLACVAHERSKGTTATAKTLGNMLFLVVEKVMDHHRK